MQQLKHSLMKLEFHTVKHTIMYNQKKLNQISKEKLTWLM